MTTGPAMFPSWIHHAPLCFNGAHRRPFSLNETNHPYHPQPTDDDPLTKWLSAILRCFPCDTRVCTLVINTEGTPTDGSFDDVFIKRPL